MNDLMTWTKGGMTFRIRLATEDDLPAVDAIADRAWETIYKGFSEVLGDMFPMFYHPHEDKAAQIRYAFRNECLYLTEADGRPVGFISFAVDAAREIATLGNNAVDPAYAGRGIGTRQYEVAFAEMKRRGARAVRVTTGTDAAHAPARAAYIKAGFSEHLDSITYYKKL